MPLEPSVDKIGGKNRFQYKDNASDGEDRLVSSKEIRPRGESVCAAIQAGGGARGTGVTKKKELKRTPNLMTGEDKVHGEGVGRGGGRGIF